MQTKQLQPDGFWLVTGAAALWGTIGVATQAIYQMDTTTSLFINLTRLLIATPVLALMGWRVVGERMFQIRGRDLRVMILTGVSIAISQVSYFAAIHYTGVAIATLLTVCSAPVFVTLMSALLKFETLTPRKLMALVCALVGGVLLVGFQAPVSAHHNLPLGVLFSLISALTYGAMMITGRFLAGGYHPLQVTAVAFAAGTVLLIPVNLLNGIVAAQTVQGWLLLGYLGLVPTALAYWLFNKGLKSVSAMVASIVSLLEPLVATLLAWALFGETLAVTGIAGALLLGLSIFLLSGER